MPTPRAFDYSVFGLHVRSELALPELLAASPGGQPEVTIRLGDLPAGAAGPGLEATDLGMLLTIDGVARYAVADGTDITIDRAPGVPDANVRLFLLGSAMGALLHQRGLLPLHANAVEIGGKAFAFMGASGSGKSTLAAWFHDHGFRVIADDVCAVRFDRDERPVVTPGLPRLRLWKEALEGTGRQSSQFSRSYAGDDNWDKYDVPLPHDRAVRAEVELAGVYLLGKGDGLSISELQGLEATEAIFANTYRGEYVALAGNVRNHWEACVRLVQCTPVFRLERSWNLSRGAEVVVQALAHALGLPGGIEQEG